MQQEPRRGRAAPVRPPDQPRKRHEPVARELAVDACLREAGGRDGAEGGRDDEQRQQARAEQRAEDALEESPGSDEVRGREVGGVDGAEVGDVGEQVSRGDDGKGGGCCA